MALDKDYRLLRECVVLLVDCSGYQCFRLQLSDIYMGVVLFSLVRCLCICMLERASLNLQ